MSVHQHTCTKVHTGNKNTSINTKNAIKTCLLEKNILHQILENKTALDNIFI